MTSIAFAAKRHWGYPEEWIELWSDELTVDATYAKDNWVFLAEDGARILGWCAVSTDRGGYWLDYCWVLPEAAGRGLGRMLVQRAFRLVAKRRASTLRVIADPNAEGFYRKLGFRCVGYHPSVPKGRRLPVLEAKVSGDV
ncbi:MAG: GNAT family N-acetyltransferase [Woeseia sp.]